MMSSTTHLKITRFTFKSLGAEITSDSQACDNVRRIVARGGRKPKIHLSLLPWQLPPAQIMSADPSWIVSDSIKTAVCALQVIWGIRNLRLPLPQESVPIQGLATFNALILGVYFIGAHEPAAFGWEAYVVFNSIAIVNICALESYYSYLLGTAAYLASGLATKTPKYATSLITSDLVIVITLMMISMVGTLATDDFRYNAVKLIAISVFILGAGGVYVYSMWRLRELLIAKRDSDLSMPTIGDKDQKSKIPENPMTVQTKKGTRKEDIDEMTDSAVLSSNLVGGKNGRALKMNKPEEIHMDVMHDPAAGTAPGSMSTKSQRSQSVVLRRKQMAEEQDTVISNLSYQFWTGVVLVPGLTVLFIYLFTLEFGRKASFSEQWRDEAEEYMLEADGEMWFGVAVNLYFMYYYSPISN